MNLIDIQSAQVAIKDLLENSATLITWSLSLVAATLLALTSTSYVKPDSKKIKLIYLLFLPGWISVGVSIFYGQKTQREKFPLDISAGEAAITKIFGDINDFYSSQILWFNIGFLCFGAWLICYFLWWIFKS